MRNDELRKYSHSELTPTEEQRNLITAIYASICSVLGEHRCRQIGSYPRYTAIRPPHDLDVLFNAGSSNEDLPDPSAAISEIERLLNSSFVPPNGLQKRVRVQSHSVSVTLFSGTKEEFGIDIVPAWETGFENEFGDDVFRVPEIIVKGHEGRQRKYERVQRGIGKIDFILTDPVGYIKVAKTINDDNPDFRRSTKCAKKLKHNACDAIVHFKFKSFHLEQIMVRYFQDDPSLEIYDALVKFFEDIPEWIAQSQINDRANLPDTNPPRKIDAYVDDLMDVERSAILSWRDEMLDRLGKLDGVDDVSALFKAKERANTTAAGFGGRAPAVIVSEVAPRAPFGG